ncbi:50S ribosomal protein L11 methyltransferase [Corallococcus terminator]
MHKETPYIISRSVFIQLDGAGHFVATNSVSRTPCVLQEEDLAILRAFSNACTPEAALSAVRQERTLSQEAFAQAVQRLGSNNILTPVRADYRSEEGGYVPAGGGFASFALHHWMLRDSVRVMAYRSAILEHTRNKVVADIGCGTGILSLFAAQAGARHVYALEESEVAALARMMFQANGVADRVTLLTGNSKDVQLPEPADVIVHEILGIDPFFENVIPYIEDARRRFFPSGKGTLIPHKIEVCCVGVEPEFVPSIAQRARLEAREFSGMYGLNFGPYLHVLEQADEINDDTTFPRRANDFRAGFFDQAILSEECVVRTIDLAGDLEAQTAGEVESSLKIRTGGRLGSLLMFFRAHLDDRLVLSTSPFSPRTHWGWAVRDLPRAFDVKAGDEVTLGSSLLTLAGRQKLKVQPK